MWKRIMEGLAAAAGAVASFFCGLPSLIWVLVAVMSIDYLTGLACGWMGVSPKTAHGGLSSGEAFKGLVRKALIILMVLLAALLDQAVAMSADIEFAAVSGATCLWFVAAEGISILENAAAMGVPIPQILITALELVKNEGGSSGGDGTRQPPHAGEE